MQTPELTFKIEIFGNLIEDLNYWHLSCGEDENDDLPYCEEKFIESLRAVRDMRAVLLEELEWYLNDCRINQVPIDLSYYRIKKQLEDSTFELIRS